jgi:hypothetical protein
MVRAWLGASDRVWFSRYALCDTPHITTHRALSAEMTYPAPGGSRGTG